MAKIISQHDKELLHDDSNSNILVALNNIEGTRTDSSLKYYKIIEQCLNTVQLSKPILKRVLVACCQGLNEAEHPMLLIAILDVISKIVPKILDPGFCEEELHNISMAILKHLKNVSVGSNPYSVVTLGIKFLLLCPDEILANIVARSVDDIFEIASQFFQDKIVQITVNNNLLDLIIKFLRVLPKTQKRQFVEAGLNFWFLKIIPGLMQQMVFKGPNVDKFIELLELLVEDLIQVDYSKHPDWITVLSSCCTKDKYPACLTSALKQKEPHWNTAWNILIKLLKTQITENVSNMGTPINSLLSVLESAFKMSDIERCKAFMSWNVLIDNFTQDSSERTDPMLRKRIKLLMIPLTANNVKVENTALAKFNTWWHLITKFDSKTIESYYGLVLLPFLEYCFGKCESELSTPGLKYMSVMKLSTQAFIEIVGHSSQYDCVTDSFPRLKQKILNVQLLVNHLPQWMYALQRCIKIIVNITDNNTEAEKKVNCLWNSFFSLLLSLPQNNLRQDIVLQQLQVLTKLIKSEDDNTQKKLVPFVFDIITLSCGKQFNDLLKCKSRSEDIISPACFLIDLISSPLISAMNNRLEFRQIVTNLKPLISLGGDTFSSQNLFLKWLFEKLSISYIGFAVWVLTCEHIKELKYNIEKAILTKCCVWPMNDGLVVPNTIMPHLDYIIESWYPLYNHLHVILSTEEKKSCQKLLIDKAHTVQDIPTELLMSRMMILTLKSALLNCESFHLVEYQKELKWLTSFIKSKELCPAPSPAFGPSNLFIYSHNYNVLCIEALHVFQMILNDESLCNESETLIKMVLITTLNLMQILVKDHKEETMSLVEKVLGNIKKFLLIKRNHSSITHIIEPLLFLARINELNYKNIVLETLQNCLENDQLNSQIKLKIESALQDFIKKNVSKKDKVSAPKDKSKPKVTKKNVNGEEFVVVQSHWKFNPKKLTEHQKEMLHKKREDIPALYQDLSQSQDEYKVTSWKLPDADSQTSGTISSSKSMSKETENLSFELKKLSNDIVPKIIDNFQIALSGGLMNISSDFNIGVDSIDKKNNEEKKNDTKKNSMTSERALTPRMSLKDRIVQNMNALAKSSGLSTESITNTNKIQSVEDSKISHTPETANTEIECTNITNSASEIDQKQINMCTVILTPIEETKQLPRNSETVNILRENCSFTNSVTPNLDYKLNTGLLKSAPTVGVSERPTRIKRKPKKLVTDFAELPLKRHRNSITLTTTVNQGSKKDDEINKDLANVGINKSNIDICVQETPNTEEILSEQLIDDNMKSHEKVNHTNEIQAAVEVTHVQNKEDTHVGKLSQDNDNSENLDILSKVTTKERKNRKSRLEKELEIDMVEGHPFLSVPQENKRKTRKSANGLLPITINLENKGNTPATSKEERVEQNFQRNKQSHIENNIILIEGQDCSQQTDECNNIPQSEDIIESSQDSTISIMSVKTQKRHSKKHMLQNINLIKSSRKSRKVIVSESIPANQEVSNSLDTENKSAQDNIEGVDTTANMDTQPMPSLEDGIITIDSDSECEIDSVIKENDINIDVEVADGDTDADIDPCLLCNDENSGNSIRLQDKSDEDNSESANLSSTANHNFDQAVLNNSEQNSGTGLSSPFKDDSQRNKDFLNNTLDISPIKPSSPLSRDKQTPSPENSEEYTVITLSSPVHSNGEPADCSDSPEVFTDASDKNINIKEKSPPKDGNKIVDGATSPDKRDQSPPRETASSNNSPRSSLALKRNRPQMKSVGRAAHMLGCVLGISNRQPSADAEKLIENEDSTNSSRLESRKPVRRNLKNSYEEKQDNELILKLSRELPSATSSPSCPILKRKHANIVDEVNTSPASKRKRVSFHDPPVSTTMVVQKYIDPASVKLPMTRVIDGKSPKRPSNGIKPTAIETTDENADDTLLEDTEMASLEHTPQIEIIKNSDLNDTDPICPELLNCKDPITNIALNLSSPAMKNLLVKELQGKVETVADLAKLTELEVNRLCIRAPKVAIAKKVLSEYAESRIDDSKPTFVDANVQTTSLSVKEVETQSYLETTETCCQTNSTTVTEANIQTEDETSDQIIKLVLKIPDFVHTLDDDSRQKLVRTLSAKDVAEALEKNVPSSAETEQILNCLLKRHSTSVDPVSTLSEEKSLLFLQNYLCDNFSIKNLIMFSSNLLSRIHKNM